jgi:signal transduction histidine kinase
MIIQCSVLLVWLALLLSPMDLLAAESRSRSILVVHQSDQRGSFYYEIFAALRAEVSRGLPAHVTLYAEDFDLNRFSGKELPPASEIRFRDSTFWEKYLWQSVAVAAVMLVQAVLISILLGERRKRNAAEAEARRRLTELAHVGRQATAGGLSSSIAHELNQPLGAILTNAETAELILESPSPDLVELREILADIRRDDQRASEVVNRMRNFLKRTPIEIRDLDLNDIMREAFAFLATQASAYNVALYYKPSLEALPIQGDAVQLQQVVLNIVVNSMESTLAIPFGRAVIGHAELSGGKSAMVSISDSGPGIPPEKLDKVFDPFFTTKQNGMGIGLSIARTIVQNHKGRIWAENDSEGGAVFHLSLPLTAH